MNKSNFLKNMALGQLLLAQLMGLVSNLQYSSQKLVLT